MPADRDDLDLSPEERLQAVARLLALGFLRWRRRPAGRVEIPADDRAVSLASPVETSVTVHDG